MEKTKQKAKQLLLEFKGENYVFGCEIFDRLGAEVVKLGKRVSVIIDGLGQDWISLLVCKAEKSFASSAAHLTKYSNITDLHSKQKMLIVDEAIIPVKAMFDYTLTITQPLPLTIDGGLDGISHGLEVLMGIPENLIKKAMQVCLAGVELIVNNIKKVVNDPGDMEARESIGLGTDLGGYAIMIGGTNGAHLNSFSFLIGRYWISDNFGSSSRIYGGS